MSLKTNWIAFTPSWEQSIQPIPDLKIPTAEAAPGLAKVVVADDDPVSREMVAGLVRKWGFQAITANDGREAMEMLRAQSEPVLAILDWMMPGLEGPDICRRVREVNRSVYVLLLTAKADKHRIVEGLEAGADDYLIKPFNNEELRARLNAGARIIALQTALAARVAELERLVVENRELKLQLPI